MDVFSPAYLLDWAALLLRWLHVIVGIAWIGASFYFVWLDNHLQKPSAPELRARGVDGELWAVHGGGFYNPQKYMVAPPDLPQQLHWFYWESYWTWISGFALFVLLYLANANTYLIDPRVHAWSAPAAVAAALGFLASGWLVYDQICRRFGHKADGSIGNDGRVLGLIAVFVVGASWAASQLFAGRAAFLIIGAMLATMMSANVLFWIIPGQKQVIADMRAGRPVSPVFGQRGKQRSVHNTYFTLPVLIAMLSNHYGMLYSHAQNWLVLVLLMAVGVLVRVFFVQRHKGVQDWRFVAAALALLAGLIVWMAPRPAPAPDASAAAAPAPAAPGMAEVQAIVTQRCVMCHNAQLAQKGVQLHSPELIRHNAQALYQQAVVQKLMPMNNATQITDAERALLGQWFEAGAQP
ncbi:urate hydroxylase PuuD [Kinneretia aquatilis]|uniref:urate hydroxylase PuuD n=1 Tax=Kinneretia aquatilis TaxID=2070761 RepID=UPI0014951B76|nr:urate hydroxylase PuuD [Paucibacter aquatile]WIV96611.1 urate hydroxylase PuuD [Paucibacter aquatile]